MFKAIRYLTCILWSIIGFLLWVPLLIRTIVTFNMVTLFTIVTQNGKAIKHVHANMKFATVFYLTGFANIMNWTDEDELTDIPMSFETTTRALVQFALELSWTAAWWGMLLYSLS